jgi:hypothetical protein
MKEGLQKLVTDSNQASPVPVELLKSSPHSIHTYLVIGSKLPVDVLEHRLNRRVEVSDKAYEVIKEKAGGTALDIFDGVQALEVASQAIGETITDDPGMKVTDAPDPEEPPKHSGAVFVDGSDPIVLKRTQAQIDNLTEAVNRGAIQMKALQPADQKDVRENPNYKPKLDPVVEAKAEVEVIAAFEAAGFSADVLFDWGIEFTLKTAAKDVMGMAQTLLERGAEAIKSIRASVEGTQLGQNPSGFISWLFLQKTLIEKFIAESTKSPQGLKGFSLLFAKWASAIFVSVSSYVLVNEIEGSTALYLTAGFIVAHYALKVLKWTGLGAISLGYKLFDSIQGKKTPEEVAESVARVLHVPVATPLRVGPIPRPRLRFDSMHVMPFRASEDDEPSEWAITTFLKSSTAAILQQSMQLAEVVNRARGDRVMFEIDKLLERDRQAVYASARVTSSLQLLAMIYAL